MQTTPKTLAHARFMRRNPSAIERKLWRLLRDRKFEGLKFRRQVPIGPYIADFACLAHKLVVEADGPFHDEARDGVRDGYLKRQGFQVLRFSNTVIENRPWELHAAVVAAVRPSPGG